MSPMNAVRDGEGVIVGYRCRLCNGVFPSMWGCVCNGCSDAISAGNRAKEFRVRDHKGGAAGPKDGAQRTPDEPGLNEVKETPNTKPLTP